MINIEQTKSEQVAAQVQDANPGNFAIEQEVAQLVGATVPAPTEPSADDARELGAQLLVFLRRALLPIRSALRTALAAIYAHLDSRCTAYTPAAYAPYLPLPSYDPMGTPPTPRSVANLLTALTAFSARKITGADVADGMSMGRILGDSSVSAAITEIDDTTTGWSCVNSRIEERFAMFTGLKKLTLRCSSATADFYLLSSNLEEFNLPELVNYSQNSYRNRHDTTMMPRCKARVFNLPKMKTYRGWTTTSWGNGVIADCPILEEFLAPVWESYSYQDTRWPAIYNCPKLWLFYAPSINAIAMGSSNSSIQAFNNCDNLIRIEFKAWTSSNNLSGWSPTNALDASRTDLIEQGSTAENNLQQFLQNFREHIALRLTANGSGKTLTLSQAVRDAIHAAEATYGIEAIIVTQKGWTLSPAPGASSQ